MLALLKLEQEEDLKLFKLRSSKKTIQERVNFGICWYPVKIIKEEIGFGGRIHIEVERTQGPSTGDHFQAGRSVTLFSAYDESETVTGILTSLRRSKMRIALNRDELPDWAYEGKLGINLQFDESTYKEMERSTRIVMESEDNRIAELRDILYGLERPNFRPLQQEINFPQLNESQNQAVRRILEAEDVAIIHGPPGTGKTTTLVQAIATSVTNQKQVLVCAPSNTAVDLLTERLAFAGLRVIRLGHPSRVSETLLHHTLDGQVMSHKNYRELKEMRKQAEEYRNMAGKYKRNFGWQEREQRRMMNAESKALRQQAESLEYYITAELLETTQVITCTLAGAANRLLHNKFFGTVFIDEAAQALETGCWIPIRKAGKVVFAGDHFQLPPTVKSLEAEKGGLGRTLMEKCIERQPNVAVMLRTQYRMNRQIMEFSNRQFYNGNLQAAESVADAVLPIETSRFINSAPFEFIDTSGCGYNEILSEGSSTGNPEEAHLLIRHLRAMLAHLQASKNQAPEENEAPLRIGVISPYKAQVSMLKEIVEEDAALNALKTTRTLHIGTVDSFQGQERDIMYISMVRSNTTGEIGFLADIRRMNVAMTRAKKKLIIIGDSGTLASNKFYQDFLDFAEETGGYKSAWEMMGAE